MDTRPHEEREKEEAVAEGSGGERRELVYRRAPSAAWAASGGEEATPPLRFARLEKSAAASATLATAEKRRECRQVSIKVIAAGVLERGGRDWQVRNRLRDLIPGDERPGVGLPS